MENDPKPYKFMKESIKKQPPDWKKIVLLIAGWLTLAALGGLVAAAVFAVTEPKIAEAVTREELPAKVDIHFRRQLFPGNCFCNLWLCHRKYRGRNQTAKRRKCQPSGNQKNNLFPVGRLLFDALFHEFVRFWVIFHTFLSPYICIPYRTALRICASAIFTYIKNFTR